jgi:hypothetical protein
MPKQPRIISWTAITAAVISNNFSDSTSQSKQNRAGRILQVQQD